MGISGMYYGGKAHVKVGIIKLQNRINVSDTLKCVRDKLDKNPSQTQQIV